MAADTAITVVMTCCDIFSTARATSGSTVGEYGLNVRGFTPAGSPKIATTSSALIFAASIIVVVGVTTEDPLGAFNTTLSRTSPEDVSIVFSSV